MKRKATLMATMIVVAAFASSAFAATTSPPAAEKRYSTHVMKPLSDQNQVTFRDLAPADAIDLKTTLRGSMPVAKKLDDGLGVPVMRVDSVISKKIGTGCGDMYSMQIFGGSGNFYTGNNGARAAPTASMKKFDDMVAARLSGSYNFGKYKIGLVAGGKGAHPASLLV